MAPETASSAMGLVLISVMDSLYGVDIMRVREIKSWTGSTPLPHAPNYVVGIFNLRGAALPIVDLGARLSGPRTTIERSSVIVVVEIGDRLIGLLVDAVCDIIAAVPDEIQPPPELGDSHVRYFVEGILTTKEAIVKLLSLDHILPTEDRLAA